ncbi:hypothetical protein NCS57_01067500 [Fusarium keratoplasticum]|uniref:Uncharacterized protein n=1 Tax=Fusarium keratoplasticum TaxID=1328300 RepID=A0ACC0QRQ0_9HYPO|nr:hypothetical protein NCS57_01067500 [Fusarium keratoplasticum]KAI8660890.1 hypothetical protein NCS57_01067500 [Fusarium keratoplasticum]
MVVIRDVHDAVQLIRETVSGQNSNEARQKALSSHLNSMDQELSILEKEIAGKDPTKLRARIVLVLKSAETERALQRLENHKTTLLLYLQAFSFSRSEGIRCSQNSAEARLQSLIEQQDKYGSAMRTDLENGLEDLSEKMGSLDSAVGISQESLKEGFSTTSREIQVSREHLRNIIRHELQRQLQPLVQETMKRSEMRRAATPKQLCPDVDAATTPVTTAIGRKRVVRVIRVFDIMGLLFPRLDLVQIGMFAVGYVGVMAVMK